MYQVMDASARGWMVKQSVRHYWRVEAFMSVDDLLQDGQVHYLRILRRYPEVTDKPAVMALFKRAFINHIHDLSKKKSKHSVEQVEELAARRRRPGRRVRVQQVFDWEHSPLDPGISDPEMATFRAFLSKAPKPVQDVIALLTKDDTREALRAQYRVRNDGTRETVNERLCRLCGYDPAQFDLAFLVRRYLSIA
jgi:hypothetical protein